MKADKRKVGSMKSVHERLTSNVQLKDITDRGDRLLQGTFKTEVTELITDSRRVIKNSAFFAIPGSLKNGSDYIEEAIRRGASTIVSNDENLNLPSNISNVYTENPRLALARFAKKYHGSPDQYLDVVGVTGTNGKTTVTSLVRHLLERPGRPVGLIGTVRYHLGDREVPSFRTTQRHLIFIHF